MWWWTTLFQPFEINKDHDTHRSQQQDNIKGPLIKTALNEDEVIEGSMKKCGNENAKRDKMVPAGQEKRAGKKEPYNP